MCSALPFGHHAQVRAVWTAFTVRIFPTPAVLGIDLSAKSLLPAVIGGKKIEEILVAWHRCSMSMDETSVATTVDTAMAMLSKAAKNKDGTDAWRTALSVVIDTIDNIGRNVEKVSAQANEYSTVWSELGVLEERVGVEVTAYVFKLAQRSYSNAHSVCSGFGDADAHSATAQFDAAGFRELQVRIAFLSICSNLPNQTDAAPPLALRSQCYGQASIFTKAQIAVDEKQLPKWTAAVDEAIKSPRFFAGKDNDSRTLAALTAIAKLPWSSSPRRTHDPQLLALSQIHIDDTLCNSTVELLQKLTTAILSAPLADRHNQTRWFTAIEAVVAAILKRGLQLSDLTSAKLFSLYLSVLQLPQQYEQPSCTEIPRPLENCPEKYLALLAKAPLDLQTQQYEFLLSHCIERMEFSSQQASRASSQAVTNAVERIIAKLPEAMAVKLVCEALIPGRKLDRLPQAVKLNLQGYADVTNPSILKEMQKATDRSVFEERREALSMLVAATIRSRSSSACTRTLRYVAGRIKNESIANRSLVLSMLLQPADKLIGCSLPLHTATDSPAHSDEGAAEQPAVWLEILDDFLSAPDFAGAAMHCPPPGWSKPFR